MNNFKVGDKVVCTDRFWNYKYPGVQIITSISSDGTFLRFNDSETGMDKNCFQLVSSPIAAIVNPLSSRPVPQQQTYTNLQPGTYQYGTWTTNLVGQTFKIGDTVRKTITAGAGYIGIVDNIRSNQNSVITTLEGNIIVACPTDPTFAVGNWFGSSVEFFELYQLSSPGHDVTVKLKMCECGATKVNSSIHSSWCPLNGGSL